MHTEIPASLRFTDAAEQWLDSRNFQSQNIAKRARYVSARTLDDYRAYVKTLAVFFGMLRLENIHIGHLRQYQVMRSRTAGPNKINSELAILKRIMRRANLWTEELEDAFEPLQALEPDIPRAMTPQEQERFLQIASTRTEWQVAYWFSLIALRTTLSNCELRGLHVGDINLHDRYLMVRSGHAKNRHRVRTIPLVADALWACENLLERARFLGAVSPPSYIFPFRICRNEWDTTRPMTNWGIKKPFEAIRREAGVPYLRIHDLRHSAITRLAECGTPVPVIMSMAGHISQRMMQHYTQISDQAKRNALDLACGSRQQPRLPYVAPPTIERKQPQRDPQRAVSRRKNYPHVVVAWT